MNKYLFVVPVCGKRAGECQKMKNCLLAAKGLAETGNVVKLVLDNSVVLPLECSQIENQVAVPVGGSETGKVREGDKFFKSYMDEGYAVIRF